MVRKRVAVTVKSALPLGPPSAGAAPALSQVPRAVSLSV